MSEKHECLDCGKPAEWIRHTQFAGDHPFCDKHAKAEIDFGKSDSYKSWEKLDTQPELSDPFHAVNQIYKKQLLPKVEQLDGTAIDWESLVIGWAIGKGLSVKDAHKFFKQIK